MLLITKNSYYFPHKPLGCTFVTKHLLRFGLKLFLFSYDCFVTKEAFYEYTKMENTYTQFNNTIKGTKAWTNSNFIKTPLKGKNLVSLKVRWILAHFILHFSNKRFSKSLWFLAATEILNYQKLFKVHVFNNRMTEFQSWMWRLFYIKDMEQREPKACISIIKIASLLLPRISEQEVFIYSVQIPAFWASCVVLLRCWSVAS